MNFPTLDPDLQRQFEEVAAGPAGRVLAAALTAALAVEVEAMAVAPHDRVQIHQGRVQALKAITGAITKAPVALVMREHKVNRSRL